jgi:hypothetical protein
MASNPGGFSDLSSGQTLASPSLHPFLVFGYMQALDMLSTLAFLLGGVEEANPFVRGAIAALGNPLLGLALIKLLGLALGLYCWRSGRLILLGKANIFFALLVVYNLCCLIIGLAAR